MGWWLCKLSKDHYYHGKNLFCKLHSWFQCIQSHMYRKWLQHNRWSIACKQLYSSIRGSLHSLRQDTIGTWMVRQRIKRSRLGKSNIEPLRSRQSRHCRQLHQHTNCIGDWLHRTAGNVHQLSDSNLTDRFRKKFLCILYHNSCKYFHYNQFDKGYKLCY